MRLSVQLLLRLPWHLLRLELLRKLFLPPSLLLLSMRLASVRYGFGRVLNLWILFDEPLPPILDRLARALTQ